MPYKTIVLSLIEQAPELHQRLKESRTLLRTMEQLAMALKASHEEWKKRLALVVGPNSSEAQLSSAALEMAVSELEADLLPSSPPDADEPSSLDGAMAYLLRHSHPA